MFVLYISIVLPKLEFLSFHEEIFSSNRYSGCASYNASVIYSGTYRFTSVTVLKGATLTLSSSSYTTNDTMILHAEIFEMQMSHVIVSRSVHLNCRIFELEKSSIFEGDERGYPSDEGIHCKLL